VSRAAQVRRAYSLSLQVAPGHQQEVLGARLHGAGAGEHEVGEGIAHDADAELIPCVPLPEGVDELQGAAAILLARIKPGEGATSARWMCLRTGDVCDARRP